MEDDDRCDEAEVCSVTVPYELVDALATGIMKSFDTWHTENEFEIDLEVCVSAILVASDMVASKLMAYSSAGSTVQ